MINHLRAPPPLPFFREKMQEHDVNLNVYYKQAQFSTVWYKPTTSFCVRSML